MPLRDGDFMVPFKRTRMAKRPPQPPNSEEMSRANKRPREDDIQADTGKKLVLELNAEIKHVFYILRLTPHCTNTNQH